MILEPTPKGQTGDARAGGFLRRGPGVYRKRRERGGWGGLLGYPSPSQPRLLLLLMSPSLLLLRRYVSKQLGTPVCFCQTVDNLELHHSVTRETFEN